MNTRSLRTAGAAALACLALTLGACSTTPGLPGIDTQSLERRAAAALEAGDQRTAASIYAQLAEATGGTQRATYLLEATRLEIALNNLLSARELLGRAQGLATGRQIELAELLLARIELVENSPADALARIQPLLQTSDAAMRADVLEVAGLAQFALGRPIEAIRDLSERELWLEEIDQIRANQQTLWLNLVAVRTAAGTTGDAIVDGWLELAPISRITDEDEQRRELLQWRIRHLQHPAARILLRDILRFDADQASAPQQVALLLPISSGAGEAARAIRDGFMAAHISSLSEDRFAQGMADAERLTVRVYDTSVEGAEAAYLRAEIEGADFIVGPLLRDEVELVLPKSGLVPTLALNHTLSDEEVYGNTWQFGLAPEDEAIAVARRAIALEQTRAVVLLPSNNRGYRIFNRFQQEYEALGGEVLAFMGYDGVIGTYGQRISTLLNLDRSNARERTLQANLREELFFEPRRRQDIDMVFLIANPADGRQLAPQLEFLYAGDIPTYSISDIHDLAARRRDSDLNRIVFPEVPWIIAPPADALRLQQTIARRWPQRSAPMARFFGMGVDSYRIIETLYRDPFFTSLDGSTGTLRMDTEGRIHRDMPFAQFRGGIAEPIEDAPPLPEPITRDTLIGTPPGTPQAIPAGSATFEQRLNISE